MRAFSRLSDMLNDIPGLFINGTLFRVGEAGTCASVGGPEQDVVVRLHDVLFVRPRDEESTPTPSGSAERRARVQRRMVLELEGWRITGNLHLVDQVRWLDFAMAMNSRFIPITHAAVLAYGASTPVDVPFLLVNGARVSALYEGT